MIPDRVRSLDTFFRPRSVAVVGSLAEPDRWWLRAYFIDPLEKLGYKGRIYGVNPKGGQIPGIPVYSSLREIPGPVDHVVCCVSAGRTPELIAECRELGVKSVQVFTAGFAETGEIEGIEIQRRMVEAAGKDGPRIIGPNCMGPYCPETGISFCTNFPPEPGTIGLLCQSGGNTTYIVRAAAERGLRFSKAVSYGNACDVNESDLIEYLTADPATRVIAAYIEGTRDGRRLHQVLSRAAEAKPVVIFKGGYTEGGRRAAISHTGSMAGSEAVWDGLLKQAGAIRVYNVEEMVDMLVALLHMKPPAGPNVCVAGNGGGASVLATDECEQAGLKMVPMPQNTRNKLLEFIPMAGSMLRNPIDTNGLNAIAVRDQVMGEGAESSLDGIRWDSLVGPGDRGWGDLIGALNNWNGLDLLLCHYSIDVNPLDINEAVITLAAGPMIAAAAKSRLPAAIVLHVIAQEGSLRSSLKAQRICIDAGIPLFLSMQGAARATARLIEYNRAHPGILERVRI